MSAGSDQFEHHVRRKADDHWNVQTARCCVCGECEDVRDAKPGGLPPSAIANKFRQRGWEIGSRRNKDRCPKHSRIPGALDMAGKGRRQRRAAFVAIGRREGTIPPADVVVIDGATVLRNIGALAMADPVAEVMDAATAAARLEVLGKVTRREPPPELTKEPPPPKVKPRPTLTVDQPMYDPPPGTTVLIRKMGSGGHPIRQTGWAPAKAVKSNMRKSAQSRLGSDTKQDTDYELFTEADGTWGWKPLRMPIATTTPYQPIVTDPPFTPSQETPMPDQPSQGGAAATAHDWAAPEYSAKRRKVLDYLDNHYDGVNRYRGDGSDRKAAEELDVPRGLVTYVREQFFGPDVNEAAAETVRAMKTLRDDANKLVEKHMALAAEAESYARRCEAALSKLGA